MHLLPAVHSASLTILRAVTPGSRVNVAATTFSRMDGGQNLQLYASSFLLEVWSGNQVTCLHYGKSREEGRTHKVGTSSHAGRRFRDAGLTKIEWQEPHGSIIVMLLWDVWEWVLVNRIIAFSQKPYEVTFYHIIYQSGQVVIWG